MLSKEKKLLPVKYGVVISIIFLWLLGGIMAAISNQSYRWYKVWSSIFGVINGGEYWSTATSTRFTRIKEFDICKEISNGWTNPVFIPTKTVAEWTWFLNYKPSTVSIGECGCYTDSDCNAGQICNGETTAVSPYCQGTFSVDTTTYSCISKSWEAPVGCWKNWEQQVFDTISDCTWAWGVPGFVFNSSFYPASKYCMSDYNPIYLTDYICHYSCPQLNQSQCNANSNNCTWSPTTTSQTYSCNEAVTTTTARCTGKEVPITEQHCYNTGNRQTIVASNYWECKDLKHSRWFYFNGQYHEANYKCMMEAWEGGEVRCFYPCRWLTQSQCNANSTQCTRTTTTTTVSPNECWDRPGCSWNSGTIAKPWTCVTSATCWSANWTTFNVITSSISSNLCIGTTATNIIENTFGRSRKCGTASCMAEKDISTSSCIPWTPSACFVAGTQVKLADGTTTNIENITKGMLVLGADNKEQLVEQPLKIRYTGKLYSINATDYFVTASHPFMTTEGWKSFDPDTTKQEIPNLIVTKLEIGDILITEIGSERIYQIDAKETNQYVYNLALNNDHTYYADGYLVHNKYINWHTCTWNVSCGSNYCTAWVCSSSWSPSVNAFCPCTTTAQCPVNYICDGICLLDPNGDPGFCWDGLCNITTDEPEFCASDCGLNPGKLIVP